MEALCENAMRPLVLFPLLLVYIQNSIVKSPLPKLKFDEYGTLRYVELPLKLTAPAARLTSSSVPADTVVDVVRNFAGAIEVFSSNEPLTRSVPVLVSLVAIGILQEHCV